MDGADDRQINFFLERRIGDGNLITGKTEHAACDAPRLRAAQNNGDTWIWARAVGIQGYTGVGITGYVKLGLTGRIIT